MGANILNGFFAFIFLLSAAVQYNDPDNVMWLAVYLAATAMCLDQIKKWGLRWLAPALLVVTLPWIIYLLPAIGAASIDDIFASLSMKTKAVEEAREAGGLAIVALWAAVLTARNLKRG